MNKQSYVLGLIIGAFSMWFVFFQFSSFKFSTQQNEVLRCLAEQKLDSAKYFQIKSKAYLEIEGNLIFQFKKTQP
jgi:hypothetical protein